ncbi:hypothetical protein SCUP515_00634 [Seiridium cupressi]
MSTATNTNIDPQLYQSSDPNILGLDFDLAFAPETVSMEGNRSEQEPGELSMNSHSPLLSLLTDPSIPAPNQPTQTEQTQTTRNNPLAVFDSSQDISTPYSEPTNQTKPCITNSFLTEQELADQKAYIDEYGLSRTANMTNLATQISQDLDQRQRERLLGTGPPDQVPNHQYPAPAYGDNVLSHNMEAEQQVYTNQYYPYTLASLGEFKVPDSLELPPLKQYQQTINDYQNSGHLYASSAYETTQQGHYDPSQSAFHTAQEHTSTYGASAQTPLGAQHYPKVMESSPDDLTTMTEQSTPRPSTTASSLDALIALARQSVPQGQTAATPISRTIGGRVVKQKAKLMPKARKAQPTPMQRAPLSISAEPDDKPVNINIHEDGTPQVILREGEDPNKPITLAECVARPRDEQLTRPRDGESAIERVRINSRRSRPPYLPLEENMTEEEKMGRAIRNQEIAELDRLDRRTRNNESARRTRERTKNLIACQAQEIADKDGHIAELQLEIETQRKEIFRLREELGRARSGTIASGVNSFII